jgi:hypothetical protein
LILPHLKLTRSKPDSFHKALVLGEQRPLFSGTPSFIHYLPKRAWVISGMDVLEGNTRDLEQFALGSWN